LVSLEVPQAPQRTRLDQVVAGDQLLRGEEGEGEGLPFQVGAEVGADLPFQVGAGEEAGRPYQVGVVEEGRPHLEGVEVPQRRRVGQWEGRAGAES